MLPHMANPANAATVGTAPYWALWILVVPPGQMIRYGSSVLNDTAFHRGIIEPELASGTVVCTWLDPSQQLTQVTTKTAADLN